VSDTSQIHPARGARWGKLPYLAALPVFAGLAAATGWAAASVAPVDTPNLREVREALHLRLPKTPIDTIRCAGLGGLCEVASKATLFYVDRQARYLVIGRLYDMETRQDLTAARLLALNPDLLASGAARRGGGDEDASPQPRRSAPAHVDLEGLPANGAIAWGPANGPKVVVFSDFHCGFCKRLSAELKAIGARVDERPISILGANSRRIAEQVICAPRPEVALHAAYSQLALANPKPCDTRGLDANEAFVKAHGFAGTPVVVRPSDGAVIEGYRSGAELKAWLAQPGTTPTKES
jgi:thiol:disulfide interchange protein DsbC